MIKIGLGNFFIVGIMAMLFFLLTKSLVSLYPVPGLTPAVLAS